MESVKQISLLPAGGQPWYKEICSASGNWFAYSSSLAIYIYKYHDVFCEFQLHSIMSEHKKNICCIAWNHLNKDLFASASTEKDVIIWNVPQQKVVHKMERLSAQIMSLAWHPMQASLLYYCSSKGPVFTWNTDTESQSVLPSRDTSNFTSNICVFRVHPTVDKKMAFGHDDGTISILYPSQKAQRHALSPANTEENHNSGSLDPVSCLEWDPLSTDYILVNNPKRGMILVDSQNLSILQRFQLPSAASDVRTMCWVNSGPGLFLTGDLQSGVLRVWSVAKSSPLENIKLNKTGFYAVIALTDPVGSVDSRDSAYNVPIKSTSGRFMLPPAYALCLFVDGGVGLYDLGKSCWSFLREKGHYETIFDCRFKSDSPDILATASFDGTIKVWDVNTWTCLNSSPGNEGIIYRISWGPADLNCIAAATALNGAFLWDVEKGRVIQRYDGHGQANVFCVSWNQKDSTKIATAGADSLCIIWQVDGKIQHKLKHPGPVYSCDWSPSSKDMIATSCEDKLIRVYYLPTINSDNSKPLRVFAGHEAKVFNVYWSPVKDGLLCSGSDDGTVRVWDYSSDSDSGGIVRILTGHTAPVRGLLWNTEVPHLLVSGSWDSTIRIWDVRDGACVGVVLDHGADVYGLSSHPSRPFVFASSSRDSTVRIWSMNPLLESMQVKILAGWPWDDIIFNQDRPTLSHGVSLTLHGKFAKGLKQILDQKNGKEKVKLQLFSSFFSVPGSTQNLWELVQVVKGRQEHMLSEQYSRGIMHMKHICRFTAGKAQELELLKTSKFGRGGGVGTPSKEHCLRQAADLYLRVGNLQRYCEILIGLGQWTEALAVAPGVSLKYWQQLSQKYTSLLVQENSPQLVAHAVATGDVPILVNYFTNQGELQDALVVATAGSEGSIAPVHCEASNGHLGLQQESETNSMKLLYQTSCELADSFFQKGDAIKAACCHLAVNDCEKALKKLLRGNELELAFSVAVVLGRFVEYAQEAAVYLSRRCERLGEWDLAVDMLRRSSCNELLLAHVCARCPASLSEINSLHNKAGLPCVEACVQLADTSNDVIEQVKYYMLSSSPDVGLHIGLKKVKSVMARSKWTVNEIWDILQLMASIQTEKLLQHQHNQKRGELLILCAYAGCLVAVRRKYNSIVAHLFRHVLHLLNREKDADVALTADLVSSELNTWQKSNGADEKPSSNPSVNEQTAVYERLVSKAGEETSPVGIGADFVSGAQLPGHTDVHTSWFNQLRIQGPPFFLEDGRSTIAVSDALMWAKCTPFSPLGSGNRINPF